MKCSKLLFLLVTGASLTGLTVSAQTSSGKLILKKKQKIQIDNTVKSLITQEVMGQSMEININASMIHLLEVKEKRDSSFLLSSTLTQLKTSGSAMGQKLDFDSDKKEDMESETGKAIKEELNVAREVELNSNAKVINAQKNAKTDEKPTGDMMDVFKNITGDASDDSNGATAAFDVIPAGKREGDSWTDSTITEESKTYKNYTIRKVENNNATIELSGTQVTNKKIEQQGLEISLHMDGKLTGEGIVDMGTGVIKQKTTVLDATGTAEMMGQSVPVTSKVTSVTTVKTL